MPSLLSSTYFGPYFGGDTPSAATGRYTTEAKCRQFLGSLNLTAYNDANDDGTEDAGSAQQAIDSAEATVDLRTGGPYSFAASTNGTIAAGVFEKWSRYLAAVEMVNKRLPAGTENADDERALVYRFRKEAFDEMKMFAAGDLSLPGATPANPATGETSRRSSAPTVAAADGSAITAAQVQCARGVRRCGGVPFVC